VVAYDIRYGPREQVTHGVDGFLVEPGDVEGMARYVVELLSSPELVNKMSVAAREKAASHGTERFLGDWKRIIEAAIAQKPMRTRIKKVKLTVQDLVVASPPARFRLGKRLQRGPSTPPGQHGPEEALVFRGTLLVLGGSPRSNLGSAEIRLAAVDDASGTVIDLPIDVDRKGRRFFLEAQVPLSNLPRASGADASNYRLRLRLNWRNSSWQTDLGRRSKQADQAEVIFDPLGTARVIV
jgi:poly(glycerol-phosphate) alpha-glucosyltransferase